jgi:hypothetical protein
MNIFYLDHDPRKSARFHTNSHCSKMILETGQMLSTAHRVLDGTICRIDGKKEYKLPDNRDTKLYKPFGVNHPCNKWVRESSANYLWLFHLFLELSMEFKYRFGKDHKTFEKLGDIVGRLPTNMPRGRLTKPAQAMPEQYRNEDPVKAYRAYYNGDKRGLFMWTKRETPYWVSN